MWEVAGHLADEFSNSDFQTDSQRHRSAHDDVRERHTSGTAGFYAISTQIRGYIRDAITAENKYEPQNNVGHRRAYRLRLRFIEMSSPRTSATASRSARNTNGTSSTTAAGLQAADESEVYAVALKHVDSALSGCRQPALTRELMNIRQAALITKARILVDQNRSDANNAAAAALVPVSVVPTTYQYLWTTSPSTNTDDNGIWSVQQFRRRG